MKHDFVTGSFMLTTLVAFFSIFDQGTVEEDK
jgi:hypothetical protein